MTAGRPASELVQPWHAIDATFGSIRLDGVNIKGGRYEHCTFANVSFLRTTVETSNFVNCVFINCYFRQAELLQSTFVGCKFVDCTFPKVTVASCDFRYAVFKECYIPYAEFEHSMPREANLRLDVAEQCGLAAEHGGDMADARRFRLAAIDARKAHLQSAVKGANEWYREHYDTLARLAAAVQLFWYGVNRAIWLHGESVRRLVLAALVAVLLIFPVLSYIVLRGDVSLSVALWWSVGNFLSIDLIELSQPLPSSAMALAAIEAVAGVVFFGLFVTVVLKRLTQR